MPESCSLITLLLYQRYPTRTWIPGFPVSCLSYLLKKAWRKLGMLWKFESFILHFDSPFFFFFFCTVTQLICCYASPVWLSTFPDEQCSIRQQAFSKPALFLLASRYCLSVGPTHYHSSRWVLSLVHHSYFPLLLLKQILFLPLSLGRVWEEMWSSLLTLGRLSDCFPSDLSSCCPDLKTDSSLFC